MADSLLGPCSFFQFSIISSTNTRFKCNFSAKTSTPPLMASSITSSQSSSSPPSLLVFSGGTAFNGAVEELKKLTTRVAHVLPVSDDGGSTAEIVRVLGGPAVGDIRSRCLRLFKQITAESRAVRRLLGHRLSLQAKEAKSERYYAEKDFKRSDFNLLLLEKIAKKAFPAPNPTVLEQLDVVDCIVYTMGSLFTSICPSLSKTSDQALPSRIKRVFYMSTEGKNLLHEVFPAPNPAVLEQLDAVDCIVYTMGSLFTSIFPSLIGFETCFRRSLSLALLGEVSESKGSGCPAVGDIRSRCLRLSDQITAESLAVRRLLGHRLSLQAKEAKSEWYYARLLNETIKTIEFGNGNLTVRMIDVHLWTAIIDSGSSVFPLQLQ
ncbi:hypothetical protein KSS87_019806 [Heliosperma pusillum]|nr:hypothetical protein KSS87_019806 [Heliosperma pusillum]